MSAEEYWKRRADTDFGVEDDKDRTRHECPDEYIETSAGAIQQLQSEVPSAPGRLGETAVEWFGAVCTITGEVEYIGEDRDTESLSSRESTT